MSSASHPERVNRGGRPRIYTDETRPRQFTLYVDRDLANGLEAILKKHGDKLPKFVGEVANGALREALERLAGPDTRPASKTTHQGAA
ncbi:hypothetical protein [Nocardiopsis synnemataformans]|uniref:hypothetical protein n=1 Tax=Nocardiopsis synnemataformans TaxID=61305 RepID=UPI003EB9B371